MFVCTTEDSEAPAAARRRLSCPEWDSFANPFPCPQGGFGDFRGEIGFLRPVSWDAVRRFVQLSKIKAPCGATLAGLAWDVAANSVPLERWRPHVPSITVGKNRGVGNEKPPPNPLDNVFTQCFQGQKIFLLFSACS